MDVSSVSGMILNNLTRNSEFLRLFKQMVFLIHRNTYGGLNKHDLSALAVIKKQLGGILDAPEKTYLTSLIDSMSLYHLPELLNAEATKALMQQDIFKYISEQKLDDFCDILIEHSHKNNGLMLSIEVNDTAYELVSDLVVIARENSPDKITEPQLVPCNVWSVIKNAKDLDDRYIHIAFLSHSDDSSSFLCYKGLCMAQQYLKDIQAEPEMIEEKVVIRKPFKPNFGYGIVSLARKITGKPLNSNVVIVEDVKEEKKTGLFKKKKQVEVVKEVAVEGELLVKDEEIEEVKETNNKGRGFFDVEQGFLFNVP